MRNALLVALLATTVCHAQPEVDVTVTVDFGQDLGQHFGTLFEARDAENRPLFGAGFSGVYNSHYRGERQKVQFFIRPGDNSGAYTMTPLPRAAADPGSHPHDLGDAVYIHVSKPQRAYRVWNEAAGGWSDLEPANWPGLSFATIRGKRLELRGDNLIYDGRPILHQTDGYRFYYYAQGHLFFYRRIDTQDTKYIAVAAVPWSAYDDNLDVDMAKAVELPIKIMAEFPYGWGQIGGQVLNCSNWGGLYAFDGSRWNVLVEADEKTSYQIYCMINHGDRLLMGHYPTGNLISYDGREVTTLEDWPPVLDGASPHAREAQTAQIYRGELLTGVWPWSELWRLDASDGRWTMMQRMFSHPPVHATPVHPYEEQARAAKMVSNGLGQRLTALVPFRDGLIVSTSSKSSGYVLDTEELSFLTAAQRDEYGAMYWLKMPGNLAAVTQWTDGPTTLRFVAKAGRMTIYQDGREIAATPIDAAFTAALPKAMLRYGEGVFGPTGGTIVSHSGQ